MIFIDPALKCTLDCLKAMLPSDYLQGMIFVEFQCVFRNDVAEAAARLGIVHHSGVGRCVFNKLPISSVVGLIFGIEGHISSA